MSKRKQGKDLLRFGCKKEPPEKYQVSKQFFIRNKFILTDLYKLSFF